MPLHKRKETRRNHCRLSSLIRENSRLAKTNWEVTAEQASSLRTLTEEFGLSISLGDLKLLDNKWYVTHSGLLRLAKRNRCAGMQVRPVREFSDPATKRWVFRAIVHKSCISKPFVGYGDADPSNTSPLVRGAEMRVAETRAVNRALRKAYGIGLCSVEELKWLSGSPESNEDRKPQNAAHSSNGSNNGQPRLRDQLCLLIRKYNLDSNLVKAYAADFCGTQSLKEASRERVESFISHLAACAKESRDSLVCRLNSYAQPEEVKS